MVRVGASLVDEGAVGAVGAHHQAAVRHRDGDSVLLERIGHHRWVELRGEDPPRGRVLEDVGAAPDHGVPRISIEGRADGHVFARGGHRPSELGSGMGLGGAQDGRLEPARRGELEDVRAAGTGSEGAVVRRADDGRVLEDRDRGSEAGGLRDARAHELLGEDPAGRRALEHLDDARALPGGPDERRVLPGGDGRAELLAARCTGRLDQGHFALRAKREGQRRGERGEGNDASEGVAHGGRPSLGRDSDPPVQPPADAASLSLRSPRGPSAAGAGARKREAAQVGKPARDRSHPSAAPSLRPRGPAPEPERCAFPPPGRGRVALPRLGQVTCERATELLRAAPGDGPAVDGRARQGTSWRGTALLAYRGEGGAGVMKAW